MTAAAIDPAVVITTALRELLDSLRELVDRDTEDPGILDDLGGLLRRARRKVNQARRAEEHTEPTSTTPAQPESPAAPVAPLATPEPAVQPAAPAPTPTPVEPSGPPAPATADPPAAPAGEPAGPVTQVEPAQPDIVPPSPPAPTVTLPVPATTSGRHRRPRQPARPGRHRKRTTPGAPVQTRHTRTSADASQVRRQRSSWFASLVTLVLLAIVLVASCSTEASGDGAAPASSSSAPAIDPAIQIECANVERAYNAWASTAPTQPNGLHAVKVRMRMDDGETFLKAIQGYGDKPATTLALAIAEYNFDMSVINASFVATGSASGEVVDQMIAKVGKVKDAFYSFKVRTCDGL